MLKLILGIHLIFKYYRSKLASYPSVKYIMESELVKESVVRGYHIYREVTVEPSA